MQNWALSETRFILNTRILSQLYLWTNLYINNIPQACKKINEYDPITLSYAQNI